MPPEPDETEPDGTGRDDGRTDGSPRVPSRDELAVDRLLGLLAHEYRRRVLAALAGSSDRGDAGLAIEQFASLAIGRRGDSPEGVRRALRHVHLPKLDDAGVVAWDRAGGTVTRGPRFGAIEPLLQALDHLLPLDDPPTE